MINESKDKVKVKIFLDFHSIETL